MFRRFVYRFQQFMYGRYGSDRLNTVLIIAALVLMLLAGIAARLALSLSANALVITSWVLRFLSDALLIWSIFRFLSRNFAARQKENQAFFRFYRSSTDWKNRYFRCPRCGQTVRVPRGKGRICIRCPRCSEKFVKRT